MTFEMTRDEAKHLSRYLSEIRSRMGRQHAWDTHGVESALGEARSKAPSPDLAVAAIKAARNPANRTPAIIALDGPHWRGSENKPRPDKVEKHERCSVCSEHHDRCRSIWADDHEFDPSSVDRKRSAEAQALIVQATKAEVQPLRPPPPPREVKRDPRVTAAREHLHDTTPATAPDTEEETDE